jgi:steroid delta-isomerase-like uncharacterized protein
MGNSQMMKQAYERISAGDLDGFMDLLADDLVEHEAVEGFPSTKEGVRQFFAAYMAAFPDLRMELEDVVESGDKVWARARCTGTHTGELMGMPPTGKSVDIQCIDIVRIGDDGKAVEHWGVTDAMKMMQQLGAIPEGAPAG